MKPAIFTVLLLTRLQKRFSGSAGSSCCRLAGRTEDSALHRSSLPLLTPRATFLPPLSAKEPSLCSLLPENRFAEQDEPRGWLPRCQALLHRSPLHFPPQLHPSSICCWLHQPCSLSSSHQFCTSTCQRQRVHPQRA